MIDKKPVLLLASAAALSLALHQGVQAEPIASEAAQTVAAAGAAPAAAPAAIADSAPDTEVNASTPGPQPTDAEAASVPPSEQEAAPAPAQAQGSEAPLEQAPAPDSALTSAPTPTEPTSATPKSPAEPTRMNAARELMDQRRAERMAERNRGYEELRARAAEVGLDLPQTPPWEQTGIQPPTMPVPPTGAMSGMPSGKRGGMTPEEREAQREKHYQMRREHAKQRGIDLPETPPWKLLSEEERQTHRETMRTMTPEERNAMRDQHWQEMRERAKARGVEMPETPPWKQAEQRREEAKARWESYNEIFDAMTAEQKEAARALLGSGQRGFLRPPMVRQMPGSTPAQAPVDQQGFGMPSRTWKPRCGLHGADPRMLESAPGTSWFGGGQPMYPGQQPHWPGGGQGRLQGPPPPAPGADFSHP